MFEPSRDSVVLSTSTLPRTSQASSMRPILQHCTGVFEHLLLEGWLHSHAFQKASGVPGLLMRMPQVHCGSLDARWASS